MGCSCFSIFLSYLSWSFSSMAEMCSFVAFISEWSFSRSDFVRGINSSYGYFKILLWWRNIVLEFSLKVICRRWIFKGESKYFIFNDYRWKLYQVIMVFFLEIYQLFLLFFITFIRWRNCSLGFALKFIFRRWMLIFDVNHFIWVSLNDNFLHLSWYFSSDYFLNGDCSKLW